ncbi:MAG: hypothetical protein NW703_14285 [Nitrospiraceae bacterium]
MNKPRRSPGASSIMGLFAMVVLSGLPQTAEATKIEVTGDYRYTFHAPETPADAKALACREAARMAVSASSVYREATVSLVDSALDRQILDQVVKDSLKDSRILEQTEKGTTVSCKVSGWLDPEEVARIVLAGVRGSTETAALGADQNRIIKILNVQDDREGHLLVTFQALRRLDWQNTAYQGTLRDQADVMVEFFDAQGALLATTRIPARRTQGGDDVMSAGQIGVHKIPKPLNTASHRVWVAP